MKSDQSTREHGGAPIPVPSDAGSIRPFAAHRHRNLLILIGAVLLVASLQAGFRLAAGDAPATLDIHQRPRNLPAIRFTDAAGRTTGLDKFRGKVVLLNVWAAWCAPCIKEMPMLDRLQATLGGPDFEVVALSIDEGGVPVVEAFFRRTAVTQLHPYVDSFHDAGNLAAAGIPLTLLIDRDGREIGRKLGPAQWDHPEMVALIRSQLRRTAAP
jgi:thiol-disulfide isomerase/thioredoxin